MFLITYRSFAKFNSAKLLHYCIFLAILDFIRPIIYNTPSLHTNRSFHHKNCVILVIPLIQKDKKSKNIEGGEKKTYETKTNTDERSASK